MTTELLLVRHGRTAWHIPNRYAGRSDISLDEIGERQAAALATRSVQAAITQLVASPVRRCTATAAPVQAVAGLKCRTIEALRELDFGIAEGRTLDEMRLAYPDAAERFLADPVAGRWPGGDDPSSRAAEAVAALRSLAAQQSDGRVLIVTHSTLIRLIVCHVLGMPLRRYRDVLERPGPTHLTTLRADNGLLRLVQYNSSPTVVIEELPDRRPAGSGQGCP